MTINDRNIGELVRKLYVVVALLEKIERRVTVKAQQS
jgi:hypothetical protein